MLRRLTSTVRHFSSLEWVLFALPFVLSAGFYILRSRYRVDYYAFVKEDGPAENLQALCALGASIAAFLLARRLWALSQNLLGFLILGFSVLTFLVFGEEISWGQRIFGWASNEYFTEVNMQGETNLHNDVRLKYVVHPTLIAIGLYGTLSPLLHGLLVRRRKYFASYFTTELPTVGFFAIFGAVYVVYEYLNPMVAPYNHGFDLILWQDLEMAETFFYLGVYGWTLLKLAHVRTLFARSEAKASSLLEQAPEKRQASAT